MGEIAKIDDMQMEYETESVFHGRVAESYIGRYCECYLQTVVHDCTAKIDVIIPDLLIHNYPVGDKRRKDGNGISQASALAIFEVKGIYVGKNPQARYPAGKERRTDKCARQVNSEYAAKAQHCDQQFAQEGQGDSGPFE
eukprot:11594419-Ditylum_brightwellii.AAC.1